jgi:hypothetical protein
VHQQRQTKSPVKVNKGTSTITNEDACKNLDRKRDMATMRNTNQDTNEIANEDANQGTNEITNEDANQGTNQYTDKGTDGAASCIDLLYRKFWMRWWQGINLQQFVTELCSH